VRANQLRLWFAAMAYVLVCALRQIALRKIGSGSAAGFSGKYRVRF
jgi:hypothetical protein